MGNPRAGGAMDSSGLATKCPSCGSEVPDGSPCARCSDNQLTLSRAGSSPGSESSAALPARFVPGAVIGERYRIVAQIGRGGMGEVYRADDLRLGQTVALKFLPESLTRDAAALARLNREVRTARQVSHPNVCRVFDIGESDKVPFITMEFVDGEDLASLVRRIGRLQPAKALQLAHQLCAGLAEIHAFGILHRDLKPANIMLDGRGNLRITDFGLAVVAQEIPGDETAAGTPAYMAPEQLAGEKPTQQSDVYALGLILYELFTGKPAFEGLRAREKSATKPSAVAKDVEPAIERAILRCLEKEPAARPRTATLVSAALPGGDPLAAAIAAGETPSPDMVAGATDAPAIPVHAAWLLLLTFVLGLVGCVVITGYATTYRLARPGKSPDILVDHAQQIITRLGYTETPRDSEYWGHDDAVELRYLAAHTASNIWMKQLADIYPGPQRLTYIQSPRVLDTQIGFFNHFNRGPDSPGLATVELDQAGRLRWFRMVPPVAEESRPQWPEVDWSPAFAEAGLDPVKFAPANPKRHPTTAVDRQYAWEGELGGRRLHVSAAAFHGRPVYFEVFAPWDLEKSGDVYADSGISSGLVAMFLALNALLWIVGIALARRNWRLGRGDRTAAMRVALLVFCAQVVSFLLSIHHAATGLEYVRVTIAFGQAADAALLAGVLYLALEPLVRRRWPTYLVSWTRLLSGRWHNGQVGRDLLVGAAAGALISFLEYSGHATAYWINLPGALPFPSWESVLMSLPNFLSGLCATISAAVSVAVIVLTIALLVALVVRNRVFTLLITGVIFTFIHSSSGGGDGNLWLGLALGALHATIAIWLLSRFGLLTLVASDAVAWLLQLPLIPAGWHFPRTAFVLGLSSAIALFAFRTALAGRPMFGGALVDE